MQLTNYLSSLQTLNACASINQKGNKQQRKLSSGMKIIDAGDGASEYVISEKMRVMLRSLGQDMNNLTAGTNVTQAAGAGLDRIMDILRTLKEKAINSANDTNSNADRAIMQLETDQLLDQIDDIAVMTDINGVQPLLYGGRFGASDGYSNGIGRIDMHPNGGFRIYDAANPSRFILEMTETFSAKIRVSDGVNSVAVDLNKTGSPVARTIHPDKSVTYLYNDGIFSFEVQQSFEIKKDDGADEGYASVNIIYEFVNTSGKDLKYDMAIGMDPIDGLMNVPKINGEQQANPMQTRYTAEEIARGDCETVLCNPDGTWPTICNATSTLSGYDIYNQPDFITVGDFSVTLDWQYLDGSHPVPNTTVGNYHYTPSWLNKSIPAGSSYKTNTIMGVKYPITEGRDDDLATKMWIQSGTKSNDGMYVPFCDARVSNLGIKDMDLSTRENASNLLSHDGKTGAIDIAINRVANFNSRFGAYQNRMEYSLDNVTTQHENVTSSESVIRDADMAKEMVGFMRDSILRQSAQSMLAQSNSNSQSVLKLLQ